MLNSEFFDLSSSKRLLIFMHRFRKAGYQAIDRICDHYYSLQNKAVVPSVQPGYLKPLIPRA